MSPPLYESIKEELKEVNKGCVEIKIDDNGKRTWTSSKIFDYHRKLSIISWSCVGAYVLTYFFVVPHIPLEWRRPVDVSTLPYMSNLLQFGLSLNRFPKQILMEEEWTFLYKCLDLLAALCYALHFAVPFLVGAYLHYHYKSFKTAPTSKSAIIPHLATWTIGWAALVATAVQLTWPTAPPWYNEIYGFQPASYTLTAHPADLKNVDDMLGYPIFANMYKNNKIVFGAFPSLHVMFPYILASFNPFPGRYQVVGWAYPCLLSWAAMYLNHHYLVDILGACILSNVVLRWSSWSLHRIADYYVIPSCNIRAAVVSILSPDKLV